MSKFKDSEGDKWTLRITIGTIRKVNDELDINIGLFLEDDMKLARDVLKDPLKLFLVLWVLVEDQAKERQISEEQFGERLIGDAVKDARDALWEAFLDFCPSQQSEMLRRLMAKTEQAATEMLREIETAEPKDLISFKKPTSVRESAG